MKNLFFLVIFIIASYSAFGQRIPSKIDSLHSKAEVEKLIHSIDTTLNYFYFSLVPITQSTDLNGDTVTCRRIADSLNIKKSFYKADFDNNGYTDLLAIDGGYGYTILLVVMNFGNDSFKVCDLTMGLFSSCSFPKIINDSIIRYFYVPQMIPHNVSDKNTKSLSLQYKDLIYKYGDFIEYNPAPKHFKIKRIEFQTSMCLGSCPKFHLTIKANKSAIFKAQMYNYAPGNSKEIKGRFRTVLKEESFKEIINLLNYINFPSLKDHFAAPVSDAPSCKLTVTYNNGQVKSISDWGESGTHGLSRLYLLLSALRFNQNWK